MFSSVGVTQADNTSVRSRTRYQLSHPGSPGGSHNPGSSTGGNLLPTGGIVGKEQPRHEKAIPMGRHCKYSIGRVNMGEELLFLTKPKVV